MSPSALLDTRYSNVLPHSIFSRDLNMVENRPHTFTMPYDKKSEMIFLNVEGWCELGVWISIKEIFLYARHLKVNGEWCEKHCSELNDIFFYLTENIPIYGDQLIYDGKDNGFIPFTQFLYLHSNKYVKHGFDWVCVEREGNHVDNGCACRTENGGIVICDMFADGTQFYPPGEHDSVEDEPNSSFSSWEDDKGMFDIDFEEFWKENYKN